MAKAAVELLLQIEMVKGLHEVRPVEMSVNPKHLKKNGLADTGKFLGEPATLPYPLIRTAEKSGIGDIGVVGVRYAGGVGWEDFRVVHFTRNPPLHQHNVIDSWQLNTFITVARLVEPRVRVVSAPGFSIQVKSYQEGILRSGRHSGACGRIAKVLPVCLFGIHNMDKVPEIAIMLHHCGRRSAVG